MLFPRPQLTQPPPRVVVTGAGIITALGRGWSSNALAFRNGRLGFRPIKLFDASRQRVKIAAEVDLPPALPATHLTARQVSRMERASKLLLLASHEAWSQAGWAPTDELPLVLGTTSGGMTLGQDLYRQSLQPGASRRGQASRVVHYQPQRQALDLMEAFGFSGPITIIANACASGGNAIGHAWHLLRSGRAPRVFAGGYEALNHLVFAGFDSLQALSPTQCRPFDARRDGLALGEGAAMLALETLDHARRRGAEILGELVGYGAATDGHHLTQPHPEGNAAFASMTAACHSAGLRPEQIGYVNAHGTGTSLNDSAEAAALNRWAGTGVSKLRVSSTKASVGHLLGAAGAVEAVICLMALGGQWLPPTATLQDPDAACQFELPRRSVDAKFDYALSNSFGFGGANATLIFRRWS
ncbi:MAG TPA: beta-ketoacyl-[acyl-carrier-protein] synthase family protein [Verrucomicrobiae bacterium]|nr:beta-ketoacyl-[acyl-carrier-protein] synthase family protein [Verrucomicrobiae bacterium]